MSKRWKCPMCNKGALAPSRMSADDVRRYCLECSATTGKLVQRVCPALEKERERKQEKAASAAKRRRATEARRVKVLEAAEHERYTFDGVYLPDLAMQMCKLKAFRPDKDHDGYKVDCDLRLFPPKITIYRGEKDRMTCSGRYYRHRHEVVMTIPKDTTSAYVFGILLHEVTHAAMGFGSDPLRRKRVVHGPTYNRAMCAAAEEMWPEMAKIRFPSVTGYLPTHQMTYNLAVAWDQPIDPWFSHMNKLEKVDAA